MKLLTCIRAIAALCLMAFASAAPAEIIYDAGVAPTPTVNIGTAPPIAVTGTFWPATQPVSGTFWQAVQPVSQSGAWNIGLSGTLPAFASTPAFTLSGTLPAFAATPTFNIGTSPVIETKQGVSITLNIAVATVVKTGAGRIVRVNVIQTNGSSGNVFDTTTTGTAATSNQVAAIPGAVGSYLIDSPVTNGIVVTLPASTLWSVVYD